MEAIFRARGIPVSMESFILKQSPNSPSDSGQSSSTTSEGDSPGYSESFNATLKFISEMLMEEEDLERKSMALKDSLALQAAEKSFYDVIGQNYPSSSSSSSSSSPSQNPIDRGGSQFSRFETSFSRSRLVRDSITQVESSSFLSNAKPQLTCLHNIGSNLPNEPRGKRNLNAERGGGDREEGRICKQSAVYADDSVSTEMLDKVLLYDELSYLNKSAQKLQLNEKKGKRSSKTSRTKKQNRSIINSIGNSKSDMVDLWTLLTQCAQAVASFDQRTATDLIKQIREHSSPEGDSTERMAHYFANGLEARLTGARMEAYSPTVSNEYSSADILRAHQLYITACPFLRMSFCFANKMIRKLAEKATRIHIIDFGIQYGFQWPGLIQILSRRPGGPPRLRITGIELPQPGFRPLDRVGETMRRLANYCQRFDVKHEFNVITKKWETIRYEELNMRNDELVVVNCINRMRHIPDETVVMNNPRDTVLKLMRRINPDLFIHGICNGTYNAPFFATRFRETLFHFSGLFDMLDTTVPREDPYRLKFEKAIYGRDIVNVIACEGAERVERPETYKQWQVRNTRAGFRQMPLDMEMFGSIKQIVDSSYNKDFVVEQHGEWLVQGWKGRRVFAISCWKPA